jgi:hypothetical protein
MAMVHLSFVDCRLQGPESLPYTSTASEVAWKKLDETDYLKKNTENRWQEKKPLSSLQADSYGPSAP